MTFEEFQEILSSCPYDRLDPETRAAVDEAAAEDERCREFLDWAVSAEIELTPLVMAPAQSATARTSRVEPLKDRASSRIVRHSSVRRRAPASPFARAAVAALALFAVLAAGWMGFRAYRNSPWAQPDEPAGPELRVVTAIVEPAPADSSEEPDVLVPDEAPELAIRERSSGEASKKPDLAVPHEPAPDLKDVWPVLASLEDGAPPAEPLVAVRSGRARMFPLGAEVGGMDTFNVHKAEVGTVWAEADFRLVTGGMPGKGGIFNFLVVRREEQDKSTVADLGSDGEAPASAEPAGSAALRDDHSYLVRLTRGDRSETLVVKVVSQKVGRMVDFDWERVSAPEADKLLAGAREAAARGRAAEGPGIFAGPRWQPDDEDRKTKRVKKTVVIPRK